MEFDLADLWKIIKQRLTIILIVTIIGVAGTAYLSFKILEPQYSATTTLLVQTRTSQEQIEYNDIIASEKLMATYEEVVKSRRIINLVVQQLSLPYSEEELLKRVKAEGVKESQILAITVLDQKPLQAVMIANRLADTFKENLPLIMKVENVSILDRAVLIANPKPVSPRPFLNMLVVSIVIFNLGCGSAILVEFLDKNIKSEQEIEELLSVPSLATVPLADRKSSKGLFCIEQPKDPQAEVIRTLRTNLKYMGAKKQIKVLMATSALPNEGKTTIITNLAVAMVQEGKKVLIVDCDLRRPSIHGIFDITNEKGLSDYLVGNSSLAEVTRCVTANLSVIPSGPIPPNPAELLGLEEMDLLIQECREQYDVILLDTSPVIPVTDAQILTKFSDGVLLIIRAGKTPKEMVIKAKALLEHVEADLLGTVLNAKKIKIKHYYRY